MLTVILANVGNPDFRQDPKKPLSDTDCYTVAVSDLAAASMACLEYCRDYALGGGNWSGGQVSDDQGSHVAYVSYNGRVWPPGGYNPEALCLYEPPPTLDPSFVSDLGKKRKPGPFLPSYPRRHTPNSLFSDIRGDKNWPAIQARLKHLIDHGPSKRLSDRHIDDLLITFGLTECWVRLLGTENFCFMSELDRADFFDMNDGLEAITPQGRKLVSESLDRTF